MTTQPTPEEIRRASFRTAFRGYDSEEVAEFLERVAAAVEELVQQRDRLSSRLGEFADKDLKSEFENVGREVASVLEAARTAAESIRDRATADASRWRTEATAEAEAVIKAARQDAEAMRSDAWTTSSQMLDQVRAQTEEMARTAERESLAVLGEAEREAHRLTSSARREAEDTVRNAKMESEKWVTDARAEHDDIIASAHRQADAAQERTRALEQRRQELMDELESVRTALSAFEGELEERRSGLGLTEPPDLPRRAVVADEFGIPHSEDWEDGHTVRVIRPNRAEPGEPQVMEEEADADALAEEVARLRADEATARASEPEPVAPPEGKAAPRPDAQELLSAPEPEPVAPPEDRTGSGPAREEFETRAGPEPESGQEPDHVAELFRRLRRPPRGEPQPDSAAPLPDGEGEEEPQSEPAIEPVDGNGNVDVFEIRERLLLPLTNQALRTVKRALTDAQNQALEQIRLTEGEWVPDAGELESGFRSDLEALVAESAEAGREAATEMGLSNVGTGPGEEVPDVEEMGADLAQALQASLQASGAGSRERSAAASRIFRGWRTDEAERRIRSMALASYHGALRSALERNRRGWDWVPSGRLCPTCRAAAEAGDEVPPAHRDCSCTISPV
ncbi:MAG: DivIVA domain-containing protein [Acidimicrobiia bacterium]